MLPRLSLSFVLLWCASIAIAQVAASPVEVPEETMQKLLIRRVAPMRSPDVNIQGTVVLRATVDENGNIQTLQTVSGHPMLVPAAIEAVKQWKYRPYLLNGIAIHVATTIRVEFADQNPNEPEGSASTPQSSEKPEPLANKLLEGHILKKVPPVYPPLARQAHIQGTVVLKVIINKLGDVRDLQLVSGHPMLAPAAIDAVRQWKYVPYELNGKTVEVETDIQVNFKLANNPPKGTVGDMPGGLGVVGGVIAGSRAAPGVEHVSEAVLRPLRLKKIDPNYPDDAVRQRIEGMVALEVHVDPAGNVENVWLVSGHPILAPTAIEAVKQWIYRPYVKDGKATSVASLVRLQFSLAADRSVGVISEPEVVPEQPGPMRIAKPQRVRVSSGVAQGLLVRKMNPIYPREARYEHIQGLVVLHVNIDKEGTVSNVELISGDPSLAPAAMEAVRQWKYRPYLLNGEAVEVDTQVTVSFELRPE